MWILGLKRLTGFDCADFMLVLRQSTAFTFGYHNEYCNDTLVNRDIFCHDTNIDS